MDDGAGGLVDQTVKFPVWFDAVAHGGTPMCAALSRAKDVVTGWLAARRAGVGTLGRVRAGTVLVPRGEFNIVIAGLAAAAEPRLSALAAAYVMIMAVAGPVIARLGEPVAARMLHLTPARMRARMRVAAERPRTPES